MALNALDLQRREFLQVGALTGGGLMLGVLIPGISKWGEVRAQSQGYEFAPNAFIRIAPDERITIVVGMAEMGQGILTSLPQIVAEELEADWSRIQFEQAPADVAYNNPSFGLQATGGSTSVAAFWMPLRKAGATAREMLISAAAATWKVDRGSCHAAKGSVVHVSGKSLSYGRLAARAATLPVPKDVPLKDPAAFSLVGTSPARLDTPQKINGTALYGMDVRVPGMLVAVVSRSPTVGGKLRRFDATQALALPGIRQVVQIGSGVAVVGDGYWAVKKARDVLELEWDAGEHAQLSSDDIHEAMVKRLEQPGMVARHDGDVDTAKSSRIIDARYDAPFLAHACMEPLNCTAWLHDGGLEVWAPTQAPGLNKTVLASIAGVDPARVQIHTMMLGGGFGRKFAQDFPIDATLIAKAVGQPVKLMYSREDDMRGQFYRPASVVQISAGVDAAGNPVSLRAKAACSSISVAAGQIKPGQLDTTAVEGLRDWPYDTANVHVEWAPYESGVGVWFWRSVGCSQNLFFSESFVDELAHAAGKDPYLYRRDLLSKQPRYLGVLNLAAQKAGWGTPLAAGRARGIAVGVNFGTYVAQVVEVSLGKDGLPRVHRVVCASDCGRVVNPEIVRRQVESAVMFGLSAALHGRISVKDGGIEQGNFDTYPVARISETPRIEAYLVSSTEAPSGMGEPAVPPLAPAVANALFVLTGKRLRSLPLRPDQLSS